MEGYWPNSNCPDAFCKVVRRESQPQRLCCICRQGFVTIPFLDNCASETAFGGAASNHVSLSQSGSPTGWVIMSLTNLLQRIISNIPLGYSRAPDAHPLPHSTHPINQSRVMCTLKILYPKSTLVLRLNHRGVEDHATSFCKAICYGMNWLEGVVRHNCALHKVVKFVVEDPLYEFDSTHIKKNLSTPSCQNSIQIRDQRIAVFICDEFPHLWHSKIAYRELFQLEA